MTQTQRKLDRYRRQIAIRLFEDKVQELFQQAMIEGTTATFSNWARTSSRATTFCSAALILSTTAFGVLAGANTPTQFTAMKSGKPCSTEVDTSGSTAARASAVIASGRSFPSRIWA